MGTEQEGVLDCFFVRKTGRWSLIAMSRTPEDIIWSMFVKMRSRHDLLFFPNLVEVLVNWVRLKFLSKHFFAVYRGGYV